MYRHMLEGFRLLLFHFWSPSNLPEDSTLCSRNWLHRYRLAVASGELRFSLKKAANLEKASLSLAVHLGFRVQGLGFRVFV